MNKKCVVLGIMVLSGILISDSIVMANWIDTKYSDFQKGTYDAELYISRRLQTEINPTDSGCIEYEARFDVNNDGYYDLVSANRDGPLRIWLGSDTSYSVSNCLTYTILHGGDCDMSDLNLDSYPELIHSGSTSGNLCIYWGTAIGPSATDTTQLPNGDAEAVYVADFDKDTYLDIAIASNYGHLCIYWGSFGGTHGVQYFTADTSDILVGPMLCYNIESEDLDKNGYLDILVPEYGTPYHIVILYQNTVRNFSQTTLNFATVSTPHGISIGDLNKDGYTDIVAAGYNSITYSSIYWGNSSGYSDGNKLNLNPGKCYGGSAIVDFNKDSLLDILYYRYNSQKPIIYYNSGSFPFFSDTNTKEIGVPLKASGGTVADFNKDGNLDIFANNDTYASYSYVFYGPNFTSYDSLPVNSDHHGLFRKPKLVSYYYSRVVKPCSLGIDTLINGGTCDWLANTPGSSKVNISIRTGNTSVPDTLWTDWYELPSNPDILPYDVLNKKYIQYRAQLSWDNPSQLPNLEQMEVCAHCGPTGVKESKVKQENGFYVQTLRKKLILKTDKYRKIDIYNLSGRIIKSFSFTPGNYEIELKNSGTYWVKDKETGVTKKVVVL